MSHIALNNMSPQYTYSSAVMRTRILERLDRGTGEIPAAVLGNSILLFDKAVSAISDAGIPENSCAYHLVMHATKASDRDTDYDTFERINRELYHLAELTCRLETDGPEIVKKKPVEYARLQRFFDALYHICEHDMSSSGQAGKSCRYSYP